MERRFLWACLDRQRLIAQLLLRSPARTSRSQLLPRIAASASAGGRDLHALDERLRLLREIRIARAPAVGVDGGEAGPGAHRMPAVEPAHLEQKRRLLVRDERVMSCARIGPLGG